MEALEDKKKVVKMSKSIGNIMIKEAIQVSKFGDGYLEMIVWEIRENIEKGDSMYVKNKTWLEQ